MLKISFHLKSNIVGRNTNARLFRFYRRLSFFISLFFSDKSKGSAKNITHLIKYTQKKFNRKMTLMRSPFHYKTSKTLLFFPNHQSSIEFYVPTVLQGSFILNDLVNLHNNLNKSQNICVTKIKVSFI